MPGRSRPRVKQGCLAVRPSWIDQSIRNRPLGSGTSQAGRAHRTLGRLRAAIEYRNADELLDEGLQGFLTWVDDSVREISDMVIDEFFSHNPPGDLQSLGVT